MSPRSSNRFNAREVARAVRAARLAGERPNRVEIDPATGRIVVILAKSGEPNDREANPWDEVLSKDANEKRPA